MITKYANLSFLNKLNLNLLVKDKLSNLLSRIISGNEDVYLTPFAKNNGPNFLLSEFNKVFDTNINSMNDVLIDLESKNRDSFGSRSFAAPWKDRKQSLLDSFGSGKSISLDIKPLAGVPCLRPLSRARASDLLKSDTSSGLPFYIRKGLVKDRVLNEFEELLERKDPCILFTRTQEQKKTRNVWGYPMADTLFEMMFYSPLLGFQKKLPYRSALISPIEVSRRMTEIILECSQRGDYTMVSIDFSRYDNTTKSELQKLAFEYVKSLFQPIWHKDINYIAERFRTIGIVTPEGIISGDHGTPSGSTFTNEVGSIIQATIANSLTFVNFKFLQIQGDDAVYLVPKDKTGELYKRFESCGIVVNRDKSYESNKYAIYLQNLFHVDYLNNGIIGGIYPIYRALNRICFQERWSDFEDYSILGKDFYSIRTICIVENCKYHPLFRELVAFVLKYDKYSLDVSDQGIASYVQMIRRTKGAGEILNHQYGDDVSGIRNFETFKLIKELS